MSRCLVATMMVALMLFSNSSCRIFKRTLKTPGSDSTVVGMTPGARDSANIYGVEAGKSIDVPNLEPFLKKELQFNTFSGKAKMKLEFRGQKQDLTAHFRIQKDEVIWASLTAVGGIMQVARIYITPDSFSLINYIDKEVTVRSLEEAIRILPVPADFSVLQNLVVGNVVRPAGKFVSLNSQDAGIVLTLQEPKIIQQLIYQPVDTILKSIQINTKEPGGPAGLLQFSGYGNLQGQQFSSNRSISVLSAGETYLLDMNFSNVELDKPLQFPFSIPRSYQVK